MNIRILGNRVLTPFVAFSLLTFIQVLHSAPPTLLAPSEEPPVCNRVRFFPAPGGEQALVGGKISGSMVAYDRGYEVLGEIKTAPAAGQWGELSFPNRKVYRWLRYEAPAGSYGKIAELEFYSDARNLRPESGTPGNSFGTCTSFSNPRPAKPNGWYSALDKQTDTWFQSEFPDHNIIGIDLAEMATARTPRFDPAPANFDGPITVSIVCASPGATIRYTMDGTMPTAEHGLTYTGPIRIEKSTTFEAVSILEDRAPSPFTYGTYLLRGSSKAGLSTFHIGNSLTATTRHFDEYARTAGYADNYVMFTRGGAQTYQLWDAGPSTEPNRKVIDDRWGPLWAKVGHVDDITVQPFQWDIASEADFDNRFFDLFRGKSPDVQPWVHVNGTAMHMSYAPDKAEIPSTEMRKLYPALTWEEACAAWVLFEEDITKKIGETQKVGKHPRVLPTALILEWTKNLVDNGKLPGIAPGSFFSEFYMDQIHPRGGEDSHSWNGSYLEDLLWYSAFYRESPEGKVLPICTSFNLEQSAILQRLAWDIVKNYPDCGLYEEGTTPAGKPEFSTAPGKIGAVTPVTLSSSTPGAFFRYTLDGSDPTRTRGYIYCGVVSMRPGMVIRAIAHKSGMADSPVAQASY